MRKGFTLILCVVVLVAAATALVPPVPAEAACIQNVGALTYNSLGGSLAHAGALFLYEADPSGGWRPCSTNYSYLWGKTCSKVHVYGYTFSDGAGGEVSTSAVTEKSCSTSNKIYRYEVAYPFEDAASAVWQYWVFDGTDYQWEQLDVHPFLGN